MDSDPVIKQVRPYSTETVTFRPFNGTTQNVPESWIGAISEQVFPVEPFRGLYEVYTPNSTGPKSQWKDFQHYKMLSELPQTSMRIPHPTTWFSTRHGLEGSWYLLGEHQDPLFGYQGYGGADSPIAGLPVFYAPDAVGGIFIQPPDDLDSLKSRALKAILPIAKAELSTLNSLYELKDFKTLPRSLKQTRAFVTKFQSTLLRTKGLQALNRYHGTQLLRELLRESSSNYLQWSFNIAPLISDLRGIYTALKRSEKAINALITASAKAQSKHYTVNLDEYPDKYETSAPYSVNTPNLEFAGEGQSMRIVRYERSKFHVQIEYNYNYAQYQVEHARLLSILDSLGLNASLLKVVWNAAKWSFVVDWVLGVSRWLDQFTVANMQPVINIRRCLWSIRRVRRISTSFNFDSNGPYKTYPHAEGRPASFVYESAYRRTIWRPTMSSIQSSGLNSKEFSLGAALVLSRRRRLKKR